MRRTLLPLHVAAHMGVLLLSLGLASDTTAATRGERGGRPFVIAAVATDVWNEVEALAPLAEILADGLAEGGYGRAEVIVTASLDDLARSMRAGDVDLVLGGAAASWFLANEAGAIAIAASLERGFRDSRGLVVAPIESGITSLRNLAGRRIAFQSADSTFGFVLPWLALRDAGLGVLRLDGQDSPVPADLVGYLYSGSAETTVAWLLSGRVDAAAIAEADLERLGQKLEGRLVTLHETVPSPRSLVLVRPSLDLPTREAILAQLLALTASERGTAALRSLRGSVGIVPLTESDTLSVTSVGRALVNAPDLRSFGRP